MMAHVCAISHMDNAFPLHIKLDAGSKTTDGYVLCEQNRVVDLAARSAAFKDVVSEDVLEQVREILSAMLAED